MAMGVSGVAGAALGDVSALLGKLAKSTGGCVVG